MTRHLRLLPWAILGLLLVLLLGNEWFGPDIWYHLYLGGRIAQTGSPQPSDRLFLRQAGFVNFYWLFQLTVRGAYALGGIRGVSFLFAALWAAALAAWARGARLAQAGGWGPLAALVALLVCQTRFEPRPEIFSYLFIALMAGWLANWSLDHRPRVRDFAKFAVLEALWCNMHGYFVFGPALVAARLAAGIPQSRDPATGHLRAGWKGLGLLLAAVLAASLASPFGVGAWEEVALLGQFLQRMHLEIQEFLPPTGGPPLRLWTVKLFWVWWAGVLAAALGTLATRPRREAFALVLAAAGLYLSSGSFRNIPLSVFLSAPLAASIVSRRPRPAAAGWAGGLAALAGAGLCAWVVTGGFYRSTDSPSDFGIRESEYAYPVRFSAYLRRTGFRGAIFNQSSDGGYLEFHFPELPLYADSRFVDTALVRGYFAAVRDPEGFGVLQRRFAFDGALLPVMSSRKVIVALLGDPSWRLAYADLHRAFFASLRSPAGAAAPVEPPLFYRGEDLTRPEFGVPAGEWVGLLAEAGDSRRLTLALEQFAQAPAVPLQLFEIAADYGRRNADPGILAAAQALSRRLRAARPDEAGTRAWLLRVAP